MARSLIAVEQRKNKKTDAPGCKSAIARKRKGRQLAHVMVDGEKRVAHLRA